MRGQYDCPYCGQHTPAHVGVYVTTTEHTDDGLPILQWACRACAELLDLRPFTPSSDSGYT